MSSTPNVLNSTSPQSHEFQIACVYALSGTYGTLPRFLYYVTLVLAIFGRNREWLVIGALVSSLTYAGTSAIHAMALVKSKSGVMDLDAFGAWAILSTAALSYVAMIHWSSTIQSSKSRVVLILWGALVGLGLIFNRTVIYDGEHDYLPPCFSSDGMLLTSPLQLVKTEFNCSYSCFNVQKPMRGTEEIVAVPSFILDNGYYKLSFILVGPVMFAAYVAVSWDSRQHTPSEGCMRFTLGYLDPRRKEEIIKMIWTASNETWYGGYFVLFHFMRKIPWSWRKVMLCGLTGPWIILCLIMDILCLPLLVTNVVLNELHLLRAGFPVNEADYNIGQWSPVVNSALVVIAAIVSKGMEYREERKTRQKDAQVNTVHELRRVDTDATLVEEGQVGQSDPDKSLSRQPSKVYLAGWRESIREFRRKF